MCIPRVKIEFVEQQVAVCLMNEECELAYKEQEGLKDIPVQFH